VSVGVSRQLRAEVEGRSLDVDQRPCCRVDPFRGVELDARSEEDSRGERSGTVGLAMILDQPPPEKLCTKGFG
jgi:hypothetical protein